MNINCTLAGYTGLLDVKLSALYRYATTLLLQSPWSQHIIILRMHTDKANIILV